LSKSRANISLITITANEMDYRGADRETNRFVVAVVFLKLKVLYGYLFPQLNRNIQILQVHTDDKESQAKRLITSAMIASLVVRHQTTFLGDDELKRLLESLFLDGTEYGALLRHFPKKQHLR